MRPADIIRKQRDQEPLPGVDIRSFVQGAADLAQGKPSEWKDYQLTAMLMAIYLQGMTAEETAVLTRAMADSGKRFQWDDIPGPKVDKHSTGGVGDKTSLILAPLVAACGGIVPMMSGRGLGHTGGTLDKLESIPGFRVGLSEDELRASLQKIGVGMIGQTGDVAPADKTLYALRDVTSTVESIPLITASILSKKLAEGIDGLVMDVKCGSGAFMKRPEEAKALAESIVSVGNANGVKTVALITGMDVPLGRYIGNSLEVIESINVLKGEAPGDLEDLSVKLAALMLLLGGLATSESEAEAKIRKALTSGAGLEKFRQIIELQGGDPKVIDDYSRLPSAPHRHVVKAPRKGFVSLWLAAYPLGLAAMLLGAGRKRAEDGVQHDVGIILLKQSGDEVESGEPIATVYSRDEAALKEVLGMVEVAIRIDDTPSEQLPLIREQIGDWR
jgi:pyrimidine-nucleoside phosphorylase